MAFFPFLGIAGWAVEVDLGKDPQSALASFRGSTRKKPPEKGLLELPLDGSGTLDLSPPTRERAWNSSEAGVWSQKTHLRLLATGISLRWRCERLGGELLAWRALCWLEDRSS